MLFPLTVPWFPAGAELEGARIVTPLEDMFWGDRRYEALDL